MYQTENLQEKWQPVLAHPDLPEIQDSYKRAVTTLILENQEKALKEDRNFFNLGKKNIWQDHLKKEIVNDINKKFEVEMRELGYL